jgi:hypothetical protein
MEPLADHCFCENCEPKKIWYRGNPSKKMYFLLGFIDMVLKLEMNVYTIKLKYIIGM